ncbi:MAG: hypothetical protein ACJATN_000035 [Neolewinella sp.]|mgnify:CR=1 FL=1|jgi:hypothetical protein
MNRQYLCFTALLCFLALTDCQNESPNAGADQSDAPATYSETAPTTETKPAATATRKKLTADDPFVISGGTVLGIRPGDAIASVNNAKKATLKTGEGDFTVYTLVEGGRELGYLMPDPNDSKSIRSIHVSSGRLMTLEGISVGSTFAELDKAVSGVVVHGSEVEGRTYATAGKTKFLLKAANFSYEVDKSKIKPGTKIIEIVVE